MPPEEVIIKNVALKSGFKWAAGSFFFALLVIMPFYILLLALGWRPARFGISPAGPTLVADLKQKFEVR